MQRQTCGANGMRDCRAVISCRRAGSGPERALEEGLAALLYAHGLDVDLVPDLYHAAPARPWLEDFRRDMRSLLVFTWRLPRAAFWTLQHLGIAGHEAIDRFSPRSAVGSREILCLDLTTKCCAGKWQEPLARLLPPEALGQNRVARHEEEQDERWYPVIDRDRCTECGRCREFCLFGVFDRVGERMTVTAPELCKPGCPACSRVCPTQAILFPDYRDDPAIAGDRQATVRPFGPEETRRLEEVRAGGASAVHEILRACGCRSGQAKPAAQREDDAAAFGRLLDALAAE
jgi:NAD-dependent dihydropyrimidine dehydrogenase PreA subunit